MMIPELRPRHIHGYGRQGIGWQQAEHYRIRAMVAEMSLEQMRAKVAELEAKLAAPLPASAALQALIVKWRASAVVHDGNMTCVNHAWYYCADELEAALRGIEAPQPDEASQP
jgi:hypothetical protein